MAFTDFKSVAHVQEKYNIRYAEEDFLEYRELSPSEAFLNEFEFSLRNMDVLHPKHQDVKMSFIRFSEKFTNLSSDDTLSGVTDQSHMTAI